VRRRGRNAAGRAAAPAAANRKKITLKRINATMFNRVDEPVRRRRPRLNFPHASI
jgi:hypothetical protein